VVDYIKPYFKAGMKKAVLVFDALTNQLKKERAHQERYGKNEDKMKELEKLLEVTSFSSDTEEMVTVANGRQLRTSLSPIRQDMLYEIKAKVAKAFGDKVSCVGSPYEVNNQLASLFNQGAIDYVVTIDSDLICLGSTVIIDMNKYTSECWIMSTISQFLSERLPEKFGTEGVLWTAEILHHVGCFLGNDYIHQKSTRQHLLRHLRLL
jgi:5'-3' exonuclease